MIPVALLLLAAATHVDMVDEVVHIPAGEWRYVELSLRQKTAFVTADYEVRSGSQRIRLALMRREDLDRLRTDRPHGVLSATDAAQSGRLRYPVRVQGDYVVVIDNRGDTERSAETHLRVALDFGTTSEPEVTRLSPRRQIVVIAISFAVFFGIVSYSARRLLRSFRR